MSASRLVRTRPSPRGFNTPGHETAIKVLVASFSTPSDVAFGSSEPLGMKSSKRLGKNRQARRGGNRPPASTHIKASNASADWRSLLGSRISLPKLEVVFWLGYLLLPASTGWLDYRSLSNEHYDPEQHELLTYHVREGWPNGLGSYKVADTWRDEKTGEKYTPDLFVEHHRSEARRLGITCFAYGLPGCAFFAFSRVARKKNTFLNALKNALLVDVAVSILAFLIT